MLTTGIFGVVKTVITFVWLLYLIDHVGRRNLLLFGALGGSVCLWIVGAYIKIVQPEQNPTKHLTGGGIAAMFFFYLWTAFYTPTWNGTPWVLNSVSQHTYQEEAIILVHKRPTLTNTTRKCSTQTCVL